MNSGKYQKFGKMRIGEIGIGKGIKEDSEAPKVKDTGSPGQKTLRRPLDMKAFKIIIVLKLLLF